MFSSAIFFSPGQTNDLRGVCNLKIVCVSTALKPLFVFDFHSMKSLHSCMFRFIYFFIYCLFALARSQMKCIFTGPIHTLNFSYVICSPPTPVISSTDLQGLLHVATQQVQLESPPTHSHTQAPLLLPRVWRHGSFC